MDERKQAMDYIKQGAIRMLYIKNKGINAEKYGALWKTVKKYRPKFLSISELAGASLQRTELFVTDEDLDTILSILKLVYGLLETASYMQLAVTRTGLKISAMQTGKGMFYITIKSIDFNRNVEIWVETITKR